MAVDIGPVGVVAHKLVAVDSQQKAAEVAAYRSIVDCKQVEEPVGSVLVLFHNSGKHIHHMLYHNWCMFALISHPIPKLDMEHKTDYVFQFSHD